MTTVARRARGTGMTLTSSTGGRGVHPREEATMADEAIGTGTKDDQLTAGSGHRRLQEPEQQKPRLALELLPRSGHRSRIESAGRGSTSRSMRKPASATAALNAVSGSRQK